jgi:hypothetical protein
VDVKRCDLFRSRWDDPPERSAVLLWGLLVCCQYVYRTLQHEREDWVRDNRANTTAAVLLLISIMIDLCLVLKA